MCYHVDIKNYAFELFDCIYTCKCIIHFFAVNKTFLFYFIEAQRFRISNIRNPHPVPAFRYNPHHDIGHNPNRFSHSQGFVPNRQDSSREIFQTHAGQRISPVPHNARRQSVFRFQGRGIRQQGNNKHHFNTGDIIKKPTSSLTERVANQAKSRTSFHVTPHKISKPQFSFLSAMTNDFQSKNIVKPPQQNIAHSPTRKWTLIKPKFSSDEISEPAYFTSVQTRRRFQLTYVNGRPREMHQRIFPSPLKNTKRVKSEKRTLASPLVPNMRPENLVIANVQVPSDLVKSDISQRNPFENKSKSTLVHVVNNAPQVVASPKPVVTLDKIALPKQLRKKPKAKKTKSSIRKMKNKKGKQKVKKTIKSRKPKVVKKSKTIVPKFKTTIEMKTTPAPVKPDSTRTKKVTKTPITTEKNAIDDDFLLPRGGSSGSWDMDHDFANSGSQEVTDSLGRDRFLPGCHCTMFCGRGYDFAGFCGVSSAEFFRPRLSKCCPLRNGSGGRSQQMPFFFDD
ncbi:uncharacterized protein LOC130048074 [Ostrea edulis]|uniref:uncharacterized protein LOC130048074 n=1 Tax=Ostrea edulis TaxID=37623 RepID=UPI0024AF8320|nr:uncharacterized protein LOC130048074 [Ostrea edulis]